MRTNHINMMFSLLFSLCAMPSCVPAAKPPKDTLTLAIEERAKNPGPRPPAPVPRTDERSARSGSRTTSSAESVTGNASSSTDSIAIVGNTPIARDAFLTMLMRSRGVPVLEQFVGLAAAEDYAKQRGVAVTNADIEFEYDLSLRRLSDPLASPTSENFDSAEAERLLDSILATRSMSRPEFMLTVRRNACLRKVLAADLKITDEQLQIEFDLAYGERIQVRHIQLGNLADAGRMKERLAAGEDFADLATRYSTNVTSARRGGLLDPFSVRDDGVALAMREAASKLVTGQISDVVRIGEWYHILKLEKTVPPTQRSVNSVRDPLRKRIEVRLTDPRMRELHEKLFTQASVQVHDAALRDAYQAVHGRK